MHLQDFSYERKQFADAAAEQEKDVRLYELICQSVLSEKDLKRVSCPTCTYCAVVVPLEFPPCFYTVAVVGPKYVLHNHYFVTIVQ